jgi:predicted MPP superfamily phosphohydrolase
VTRVLIAIAILASLNFYVAFQIINRWPWAGRHVLAAGFVVLLFFALQLSAPFGDRLLFPALRKKYAIDGLWVATNWASYLALGILSCLFLYMVATDIVALVWKLVSPPSRAVDFDRRALLTLGIATLGTTALGVRQAMAGPVVRVVEIALANLPAAFDGFKIAQISDLHAGPLIGRRYVENVVGKVNDLQPDLIALTGDFVDGTVDDLRADLAPLAALNAPCGTFYVTGNHEYYWGASAWIDEFTRLGARVLNNEHQVIRRDGAEIVVAGVTDYSTRHLDPAEATSPERAVAGAPAGLVKILLAHQPASYQMAHAAGFDLQMSGHTHAGQYFPFSLLVGLFQRYYKGLNRHGTMWIYVNGGTGYWGPPLRTGIPSEITLIKLKSV